MNLIQRLLIVIIVIIAVIFFLYPVLHEAGHIITAYLLGIRVEEASFFSDYYVKLRVTSPSAEQALLLAFGSSLFPALCLAAPHKHLYIVFFARLTVLTLWFFSSAEALVSVFLFSAGVSGIENDAAAVLSYYPEKAGVTAAVLIIQMLASGAAILLSKPLKTAVEFLSPQKAGAFA